MVEPLMWPGELDLLDLTLPTPAGNLALDEALLLTAEEQAAAGCLRLWESPQYAVVLGRSGRVADDVDVDACRRDGVPILRRCSGGGTVLLGPGCLVFTLVLPYLPERGLPAIHETTASILERLVEPLRRLVPGVEACGTSDLALGGVKVSGNSQRWLRRTLLHHGTLLYDFSLDRISRYLKLPESQPAYRAGRAHAEFVTNLPLPGARLRQLLVDAWQAKGILNVLPNERAAELAATKYATDAWNLQR